MARKVIMTNFRRFITAKKFSLKTFPQIGARKYLKVVDAQMIKRYKLENSG